MELVIDDTDNLVRWFEAGCPAASSSANMVSRWIFTRADQVRQERRLSSGYLRLDG